MNIFGWQLTQLVKKLAFWELIFAPVGIGWTLSQIVIQNGFLQANSPYLQYLWLLLPFGLVLAFCFYWPKRSISIMLPNIDTEVEVRVGDIFKSNDPIVVAIPTTLETEFSNNAIDRTSVQGQFTLKYCGNPATLDDAIVKACAPVDNYEKVNNFYSENDEVKKFPPGEVFVVRDFSRVGYLLTFASFNDHGVAQITPEDFFDLLPKLWLGVRERGDVSNIDVPLIPPSANSDSLGIPKSLVF